MAINLPERVRDRIAAGTENLRGLEGIRWVAADRVHLTLKFLGEVDEESERSIAEALVRAVVGHAPFEARVTAPGAFPNIRRPRIIWLGLALADLGFEREQRAFRPHLTLGRVRRGRRVDSSALDSLVRRTEVSDAWQVDAMDLMRSHLLPTGAVYDVRASARLTG